MSAGGVRTLANNTRAGGSESTDMGLGGQICCLVLILAIYESDAQGHQECSVGYNVKTPRLAKKAGSWSWFEVRVAQPVDKEDTNRLEVKRHLDGSEMSWCSHAHPVDQETAQQQGNFAEHKGLVFDSDHELWDEVGEGDVLQVVMKVQFGGWANKASDGMLQISTWWEPSTEMLDMMGQSGKI
ncbi:hypothetical protein RHS04_02938 [Rhizoctonia solani]|uniref:Uncharacterized protein n=1 Tax=Rhizoctonia solani TaxID=456999 RepID=A0A8H7H9T4_9AGAM|nr:hypothetical protein RHS04_02938 [Rhizoctonia solani]